MPEKYFGSNGRYVGIHVAERSLFLAISRILWAFDITPVEDENGSPIIPDQERLTQGFVCMPEEYRAKIMPRSPKRAELVRNEWKAAEEALLDPASKQWISSPLEP